VFEGGEGMLMGIPYYSKKWVVPSYEFNKNWLHITTETNIPSCTDVLVSLV
jgi:hypothetical protein